MEVIMKKKLKKRKLEIKDMHIDVKIESKQDNCNRREV